MLGRERYLHFDNIDMELPDITSRCSQCGQTFKSKPELGERVDNALLRVRGQFNAHQCHDPHADRASTTHYHICWSDSSLDWKACPTEEENAKLAGQIKRPNESYMIVARDSQCERCKELKKG
jgi:hypothetical protein